MMLDTIFHGPDLCDQYQFARRHQALSRDYKLFMLDSLNPQRNKGLMTAARGFGRGIRRQFFSHYCASPPQWRLLARRLRRERVLPDFCVIGPAKSGTTDLAVALMSHPNVLYPLAKEIAEPDPRSWNVYYPTVRAVRRHAARHGVALCPYIAPFLHRLEIPLALSAVCPDVKIVINLRNPADLVFSMWKWMILQKEQPSLDSHNPFLSNFSAFIDRALEVFPAAPSPFGYALHFGLYWPSVQQWLRCFPDKQVLVFDVSEYFRDRAHSWERIEGFVGLPHVPLPRHLPVTNRNPLDIPKPTAITRKKLEAFFEPYNRRLWEMLGTEFSW
jgi:hypothetical protein